MRILNKLRFSLLAATFITFYNLWFSLAAGANDSMFPPAVQAKPFINFDGRGFLIHGKRTFIASGCMDYARVPRALWRDRLLRMKRAGLNCVEFYAFWNYHEPHEGQWDFSGSHDVNSFLKLIHQMNMYAIVRPGPYVCAEWDSGGYPIWLRFKPGVKVREPNPQFEMYVGRWFDKIMPIISANQISHGGAVIMVQLENEHPLAAGTDMPNNYFKYLQAKAVALGLQVPYFFSGVHHGNPGNIPWDSVGRSSPWFTTEYYPGWYDIYGPVDNPEERLHDTWKLLSQGGNGYNYYMFHGGTNFDYTNNNEDAASYDYGSPIGEAGDLRPDYYTLKNAALFATSFQDILESSVNATEGYQGIGTGDQIKITARKSDSGTIVFLDNLKHGPNTGQVKDASGRIYPAAGPIQFNKMEIVPVVKGFSVTSHIGIAFSATRILGIFDQGSVKSLVVYGHPGEPGEITFSVQAGAVTSGAASDWKADHAGTRSLELTFAGGQPRVYGISMGAESLRIIAMSFQMAERTWLVPANGRNYIICGPAYVGDVHVNGKLTLSTEHPIDEAPSQIYVYRPGLEENPQIGSEPAANANATAPILAQWQTHVLNEQAINLDDSGWRASMYPEQMGIDGNNTAYAWYRTRLNVPKAGVYDLWFISARDKLIPFLDGEKVKPLKNQANPLELNLPGGSHSLAILAAHYGRDKVYGYMGPITNFDSKGLIGPAFLRTPSTRTYTLAEWKGKPARLGDPMPAEDDPTLTSVQIGADLFQNRPGYYWIQTTLPPVSSANSTGQAHFDSVDDNATVYLNGNKVAEHEGWDQPFDVQLTSLRSNQPNILTVLIQNEDGPGGLDKQPWVTIFADSSPVTGWKMHGGLDDPNTITSWIPTRNSPTGLPVYYRTTFNSRPFTGQGENAILRVLPDPEAHGFIWVNGHNLGRYPQKVAMKGLYVPECWLNGGTNVITVFDEDGLGAGKIRMTIETSASRLACTATVSESR